MTTYILNSQIKCKIRTLNYNMLNNKTIHIVSTNMHVNILVVAFNIDFFMRVPTQP